jgi:hypothetical protein
MLVPPSAYLKNNHNGTNFYPIAQSGLSHSAYHVATIHGPCVITTL